MPFIKHSKTLFILCLVVLPAGIFGLQAPVSTLSNLAVYTTTATVPVTVTGFNDIATGGLMIEYNPAIATATNVIQGNSLQGIMNFSINVPGIIYISWFTSPGINLPNGTEILKLVFQRVSYGTTNLNWNDQNGVSCEWTNSNQVILNDIPTSSFYINGSLQFRNPNAPVTFIREKEVCQGTVTDVPVQVRNLSDIGKFTLTLKYNTNSLAYQSFTNNSGFPSLNVVNQGNGNLLITGSVTSGSQGITMQDSSVLLTLKFYHSSGTNVLNWIDGGTGCAWYGPPTQYFNLNDIPQANYYKDGNIVSKPFPYAAGPIFGPPFGNVCKGLQNYIFVVDSIPYAQVYNWTFPPGFQVVSGGTTNVVNVYITPAATDGDVTVFGSNACGNGLTSPPYPVTVKESPVIVYQPVTQGPIFALSGTATFSVTATGDNLTFQWQEMRNDWIAIPDTGIYSGTSTTELTITHPPYSLDSTHYRCKIGGFCPPEVVTDGQAFIRIDPAVGTGETKDFKDFTIFPVPVTRETIISIRNKDYREIEMELYQITGELAGRCVVCPCDETDYRFSFPFTGQKKGIFLLHILCKDINGIIKKDIKTLLEM